MPVLRLKDSVVEMQEMVSYIGIKRRNLYGEGHEVASYSATCTSVLHRNRTWLTPYRCM